MGERMAVATSLPTPDALDLIANSSTAAFAIDRADRIIYWNAGAAKLLGWTPGEMIGRFCFEALEGRDPFGNVYCTKQCPIMVGTTSGEETEPYMLRVMAKSKGPLTIRVRAVALPNAGEGFNCLMHLVDHGDSSEVEALVKQLRSAASGRIPSPPAPDPLISVSPLTTREKEIIHLLSNGFAALNIAAKLNLSHATVRNHIQNILRKLEVHSQVEAISVAFRRGWI
jgi:DNA-binding CsgD family transcriptional regulator